MRVLLLAHKPPFPLQDGYNLHNYHHARELAARHEVHLVTLSDRPPPRELDAIFRSVHWFEKRASQRRGSAVSRALRSFSVHEVFEFDPEVLRGIQALQPESFDVVWTGGIKMLVYSRRLHGVRVLGDVADDETGPARARLWKSTSPREFLRRLRDLSKITRYERVYFRHLDVCTVVAESDRDAIAALNPELDVRVVPNGVDVDYFAPAGVDEEPATVVFEGNMAFPPNVEGVVYFAREILPAIREREPRIRFTIAGKDPTREVRALESEHIHVTGVVDDVRPYLARAALFVCPLISGTGIKNKILQAWSMAKCVVATSKSCGGLAIEPGANIVVADGAREFADTVVELLRDPERRRAIGARGRATVLAGYAWQQKSLELEAALCAAANRPAERASA
jgi:glycosyltransferase involved in cell wall biosynthesis